MSLHSLLIWNSCWAFIYHDDIDTFAKHGLVTSVTLILFWVFPLFPNDEVEGVHFWQEYGMRCYELHQKAHDSNLSQYQ